MLVVAGPGTGKTRTLTSRISYLVKELGADPASILAITFTHRAAEEMRSRLNTMLDTEKTSRIFINTIHALGLMIVLDEAEIPGFTGDPVLLDEDDKKALMRAVLKQAQPPASGEAGSARLPVEKVIFAIEKAMNRDVRVSGVIQGFDLEDVLRIYTGKKRAQGALDFDDLIHLPLKLFREKPELLNRYRARFRHLFIDEYQDVNAAQVSLVRMLGTGAKSIMAIGDPDQAIYSFRGSDVENFLSFPDTFPGAEVMHLDANYRSTVTILSASDHVIRKNPDRFQKAMPAAASEEKGIMLDMRAFGTAGQEAVHVSRKIAQLVGGVGEYGLESEPGPDEEEGGHGELFGFSDIAVLYRLNAQASLIQEALDRSGIPYQRVGTVRAGKGASGRARDTKKDPRDFIKGIAPLCREDPYNARAEKVTLSTIHGAKGLEFPIVFITGLEQGVLPFIREHEEEREAAIEEERRLLYVGMTRARKRLYLVRARQRTLFGKKLSDGPSPFLADISGDLVKFVRQKPRPKKKPRRKDDEADGQMKLF